MLSRLSFACALASITACDRGEAATSGDASPSSARPTTSAPPQQAAAPVGAAPGEAQVGVTPNAFLQRGTPSFIVGTLGDDRSRRATAGQARMIAGLFFPAAPQLRDEAIGVAGGASAWPANPVVYGGPHVNRALAELAPSLPFEMDAERLVIGGETMTGVGLRLITVIPARAADARGPGYPEFLLYAGTGPDGVAEINALGRGSDVILVGDAFGRLRDGHWVRAGDGTLRAELGAAAPRIEWRSVDQPLPGVHGGAGATATFRFPAELAIAPDDDAAVIEAAGRGLRRSIERLQIEAPVSLTFFVYPDAERKAQLTGDRGDGHAVPSARALHVLRVETVPGAIERLVAHEGTHVLVRDGWGAPGSPALGEGIAVWASGGYGGKTLDEWKSQVKRRPIADVLGKQFFAIPEQESYPLVGLLVEAAIGEVGLAKFGEHLYPATSASWDEACTAAGTTAAAIDLALDRLLGG